MEHTDLVKRLIKKTLRLFYDPCHIVITDILLEKMVLYDTEICERMKMLSKEFNKLIVKLREDKIVKHETKIETRSDGRQMLRSVFYIDYGEVKNIIKYKVYKMSRMMDAEIKKEGAPGFECLACKKEFTLLEAQCVRQDFMFRCDECMSELSEHVSQGGDGGGREGYTTLMCDIKGIIDILKEVEKYVIPTMDYFQVLKLRKEKEESVD